MDRPKETKGFFDEIAKIDYEFMPDITWDEVIAVEKYVEDLEKQIATHTDPYKQIAERLGAILELASSTVWEKTDRYTPQDFKTWQIMVGKIGAVLADLKKLER